MFYGSNIVLRKQQTSVPLVSAFSKHRKRYQTLQVCNRKQSKIKYLFTCIVMKSFSLKIIFAILLAMKSHFQKCHVLSTVTKMTFMIIWAERSQRKNFPSGRGCYACSFRCVFIHTKLDAFLVMLEGKVTQKLAGYKHRSQVKSYH